MNICSREKFESEFMNAPMADVRSVHTLEQFRQALVRFGREVEDALSLLELELRRVQEWIEVERPDYWAEAYRQASQRLAEARIDLERCDTALGADERPGCQVQRKAYERARRRLAYCEEQQRVVRQWRAKLDRARHTLDGRIGKLREVVELGVARAVATLEQKMDAIRAYLNVRQPVPDVGASTAHVGSVNEQPGVHSPDGAPVDGGPKHEMLPTGQQGESHTDDSA